jgi:hypothetical protein
MVKKRIEQIDTALDTGADILSCYNPMSENNNQSELNFYVCTHGEFIPCIEINHYGVPNQLYGSARPAPPPIMYIFVYTTTTTTTTTQNLLLSCVYEPFGFSHVI